MEVNPPLFKRNNKEKLASFITGYYQGLCSDCLQNKLSGLKLGEHIWTWKPQFLAQEKTCYVLTHSEVFIVYLFMYVNVSVQPEMQLKPNVGSDRAWVWTSTADFADGEPKPELLAIRFANAESKCAWFTAIPSLLHLRHDPVCW